MRIQTETDFLKLFCVQITCKDVMELYGITHTQAVNNINKYKKLGLIKIIGTKKPPIGRPVHQLLITDFGAGLLSHFLNVGNTKEEA